MLTLKADPTFTAKVSIPRLGMESAEVEFTFKHRTREQFKALLESETENRADEAVVMDIAAGWGLVDNGIPIPYTEENVRVFCDNFTGAAPAIVAAYMREFARARLGN